MDDKSFVMLEGYDNFLREIKQRIQTAQIYAALAINRELVSLLAYWTGNFSQTAGARLGSQGH